MPDAPDISHVKESTIRLANRIYEMRDYCKRTGKYEREIGEYVQIIKDACRKYGVTSPLKALPLISQEATVNRIDTDAILPWLTAAALELVEQGWEPKP